MKRTPLQTKRLWALVDLMKYDPDPEMFDQTFVLHNCGTPACLLGHLEAAVNMPESAQIYFGLTSNEWDYLFCSHDPYTVQTRKSDTGSIAASRVIDVIEGGS